MTHAKMVEIASMEAIIILAAALQVTMEMIVNVSCRPVFLLSALPFLALDDNFSVDTNYCNVEGDPCLNGGSCIPVENTYSCQCTPTKGGVDCQNDQLNNIQDAAREKIALFHFRFDSLPVTSVFNTNQLTQISGSRVTIVSKPTSAEPGNMALRVDSLPASFETDNAVNNVKSFEIVFVPNTLNIGELLMFTKAPGTTEGDFATAPPDLSVETTPEGRITIYADGNPVLRTEPLLVVGNTYHLIFSFDHVSGVSHLYLNGDLVASSATSPGVSDINDTGIRILVCASCLATLDELAAYDTPFTEEEIAARNFV